MRVTGNANGLKPKEKEWNRRGKTSPIMCKALRYGYMGGRTVVIAADCGLRIVWRFAVIAGGCISSTYVIGAGWKDMISS